MSLRAGLRILLRCKVGLAVLLTVSTVLPMTTAGAEETAGRLRLMPYPKSVESGQGYFAIGKGFHAVASRPEDERLSGALTRALTRLDRQCGGVARSQDDPLSGKAALTLDVAGPGEAVQSVKEDESYQLKVASDGVVITARTDVGAMHGLETMLQLVVSREGGCALPVVSIDDAPRFPWRGFMLDVVRHFEPLDQVKRTIDGMAVAKLNVFHWHLSDDEGFRAESKRYPKLTQVSRGEFYTQEQMREIVAYARARGIRVLPEFDVPGHSTVTVFAYPELGSEVGSKEPQITFVPNRYRAPRGELDPSNEKVYKFLDTFIGEMTEIFPDAYFHIGGDEVEAKAWLSNPRIHAFMDKKGFTKPAELQAYFNQRVLAIVTKHHRQMVGWDEILAPTLPKDIMIQSWRGEASLAEGAKQGYTGILSAPYYLDAQKTSAEMYLADPIPADTQLNGDQQKLILGGEATMWAEQLHEETVDSRIWPRLMAVAERYWSQQSVKDVPDMYRRLRLASLELEDVGLRHISAPEGLRRNLLASLGSTDGLELRDLNDFAAALEPVSFGERSQTQHTDALMSLDRMVDAVVADPPARQEVAAEVESLLKAETKPARTLAAWRLRRRFERWQQVAPEMAVLAAQSPRLSDVGVRAQQLGSLSGLVIEAVSYIEAGVKAPAGWRDRATAAIAEAEKPSALVRFVFLPSLKELVAQAGD